MAGRGRCMRVDRVWVAVNADNQATARVGELQEVVPDPSLVILLMLVVTGMVIYPLDQLGLRAIPLRAPWLPPRYEVNTWGPLLRSLAVSPEGWLYATHKYGIFFSQDGGQRWQDLTERIPGSLEPQQGLFPPVLALCPFDPRIIVASKGRGLARSDDGG